MTTTIIDDFATMSTFGATGRGGVERQAASEADRAQREWLERWLTSRGFSVHYDRIGNQFGLYEFTPGAPYVLAGSHMDSQPNGGKYDGAYGVLAGAHAADRVRKMHNTGRAPKYNVGVVNWFNEEGSRFKPSMMGSSVLTGKTPLAAALESTDSDGISVADALTATGQIGATDVSGNLIEIASYAEIHIEQGAMLDKEGIQIGLVTSTWAANKYEIKVVGAQSHTGSTPMPDRQDALYGAALAVVAIRELANKYPGQLHTSCGQLNVYPNSPVVVPSHVHMHLDLRSADQSVLDEADSTLKRVFSDIEIRANVRIEKMCAHCWRESNYQDAGVELARKHAHELGYSAREIRTLAGHDSTNMKDIVPTIMLFIPSVDGISHSELEYTTDEDLERGATLLTACLNDMVVGALD